MPPQGKLPQEEFLVLLRRMQQGDKTAENILTENNMPLVHSIARRFKDRGCEYEDLFQIGCIGLVKALRNFDSAYEVRFSTYAVPMIMGEIRRFLRDDGMIKVSRSIKEKARILMAANERLQDLLGRQATMGELARELGIEQEEIARIYEACAPVTSINAEGEGQEEDMPALSERIADESSAPESRIDRMLVEELLQAFDAREQKIIRMRYFSDSTQSEIAGEIGVSQVQVSRLENKILRRMKTMILQRENNLMQTEEFFL